MLPGFVEMIAILGVLALVEDVLVFVKIGVVILLAVVVVFSLVVVAVCVGRACGCWGMLPFDLQNNIFNIHYLEQSLTVLNLTWIRSDNGYGGYVVPGSACCGNW